MWVENMFVNFRIGKDRLDTVDLLRLNANAVAPAGASTYFRFEIILEDLRSG